MSADDDWQALALKEALHEIVARELDPERSRRTPQGRLSDGLRERRQPNHERSPSERVYPTPASESRQRWDLGAARGTRVAAARRPGVEGAADACGA
jgi:hypothetical protein